jgi:hypothetical protein
VRTAETAEMDEQGERPASSDVLALGARIACRGA